MASKDNNKTTTKDLLNTAVSLVQNRFQYRVHQYKAIGIEKGSKLAVDVIIGVVVLLAFGFCWFFLNLSLGYILSSTVFGGYDHALAMGFGVVALIQIILFLIVFALKGLIRGMIEYVLSKKLR